MSIVPDPNRYARNELRLKARWTRLLVLANQKRPVGKEMLSTVIRRSRCLLRPSSVRIRS